MRIFRGLTVVWIIGTLVVLGMPSSNLPSVSIPNADKIAHALIFTCGGFLASMGWPNRIRWAALGLLLFASFAEVWQHLLPTNRQVERMDTFANITGVVAGFLVGVALRRLFRVSAR